ncbi:MAG: hypothetical protein HS132_11170 [Planctomycetia bacterium]|nr:hypothetical protein [Planctomycetia bacterium]
MVYKTQTTWKLFHHQKRSKGKRAMILLSGMGREEVVKDFPVKKSVKSRLKKSHSWLFNTRKRYV